MSNVEKLSKSKKNCSLFMDTILTFKNSQGFYSRLYNAILEMEDFELESLIKNLKEQDFHNTLDVVLWLET